MLDPGQVVFFDRYFSNRVVFFRGDIADFDAVPRARMATKRNETRLDARKDYSPSNESLHVLKDAASARRGDAKVDRVVFDPLIRTATVPDNRHVLY